MHRTLLLALLMVGCGGSTPTAPPTPAPPVYPNMVGGWAGTVANTWIAEGPITGSRTCSETWLITAQSGGAFSGAFQTTPGTAPECARSGSIEGNVSQDGTLSFRFGSGSGISTTECVRIAGPRDFQGLVSPNGAITAGSVIVLRCPFRGGQLDYQYTTGYTLNRR